MLKSLFAGKRAIPIYRKRYTRFLGLFLLAPNLWAASATYCLHRSSDVSMAMAEVNSLLLKDERRFELDEQGCITGQLRSEERVGFLENYLSKRFPISRTIGELTSNSGQSLPPCLLNFEAKGQETESAEEIKFGTKTRLNSGRAKKDIQKKTQLTIAPGLPGKISVQGEELEVICRPHANETFELEISRRNKSSSISSVVTAKKGEAIELGSFENSEQTQQQSFNVAEGIERSAMKQNRNITYIITVN